MVRKKLVSIIAGGALVLVSVLGTATYHVVAAQSAGAQSAATATPTTTAPAQAAPTNQGRSGMNARVSNTDLAAALNITAAQLTTAQQTATTEAIKQAVAAGLITQAQADQFTQNSANGQPRDGNLPWLQNSSINYADLLAKALAITTEQLKAAEVKAYETSLATAVTNGTMTQAQADAAKASYILQNSTDYQNALKTAYEAAVKQAVTSGLITQAQADVARKSSGNRAMMGAGGAGKPASTTSTTTTSTKTDFLSLLAKALGISTDQIKTAYQQATSASLDQAVADGTMTQAQADTAKASAALTNSSDFQAAMKAANEAAIKQAVASGLITQAQADAILKNTTTFVVPGGAGSSGLGMPGLGGGPGGPGGRGGHGGFGGPGGTPPTNNSNSNSTGTTNP